MSVTTTRTTVRIDDDLLTELKARAQRKGLPLTRLVNRVLRIGLEATNANQSPKEPCRESTYSMGLPRVNLDKALGVAAGLEDTEIRRRLS